MTLDRTQTPPAQSLEKRSLPSFNTHQLSNGLTVYMLPFGSVPLVEIRAIYKAGTGYQSKIGLANYTLRNMLEGTANYSSLELAQKLDNYGAFLQSDTGVEYGAVQLASVSKHIRDTLPIFKEVLLRPSFPKEEFLKMQERSLQKLRVSEEKTAYLASRRFRHELFGASHPYGMHSGSQEIQALSHSDLLSYYNDYLYPGNFCLTISGVFDEREVLQLLEEYFGNLQLMPPIRVPSAAKDAIPKGKQGRVHLPHSGMQATVKLGHLGFDRFHPDFYKMGVVNTVLGGFFWLKADEKHP